jgi:hypothetical protein
MALAVAPRKVMADTERDKVLTDWSVYKGGRRLIVTEFRIVSLVRFWAQN